MERTSLDNTLQVDECRNAWILLKSVHTRPGQFYYFNPATNERSWNTPVSLGSPNSANCDSREGDSFNQLCRFTYPAENVEQSLTLDEVVDRHIEWKLQVVNSSRLTCSNYAKKILAYYEKNIGATFDFSLQPVSSAAEDCTATQGKMSRKRHAGEFHSPTQVEEETTAQCSYKRARNHSTSAHKKEPGVKNLSKKECGRLRKNRQPPKKVACRLGIPQSLDDDARSSESSSKYDSSQEYTRVVKGGKIASNAHSPAHYQSNKSATQKSQNTSGLTANRSWHGEQSNDTPPIIPMQRTALSATATLASFTTPKTGPREVKINIGERRLILLREKLKRDQEFKDNVVGKSSSPASIIKPRASLSIRLVDEKVQRKTTSESTTRDDKQQRISVGVRNDSPLAHQTPNRFDESHSKKIMAGQMNSEQKSNLATPPQEKPEKQPLHSCGQSKNLATKRLENLKRKLLVNQATSVTRGIPPSPTKSFSAKIQWQTNLTVPSTSTVTKFAKVESLKAADLEIPLFGNVPRRPDAGNVETNAISEEQMEWEPSDYQLNKMIMDIQEVRSQIQSSDLNPSRPTNEMIRANNKKSNYFIVLDSNILIGHLKLVEALRDRQFQALEPLVLILPWVVIQELDHLKDWHPKKIITGHSAMAGSLARMAVKWINKQLEEKHPRVKGQTSFKRTGPEILCSVADDSILLCCQEMEPFATNVVLLTEDVNLRNKAMLLNIQVKSQSQLKAKLGELATPPASRCSSNISSLVSNQKSPECSHPWHALDDNIIAPWEAEKSDAILCDVKICVLNYLTQVIEPELKVAYGQQWATVLKVKPPWLGMSDVVQVIIDLWRAVFNFVCGDRSILDRYKELRSFLQDKKAYNYSLKEVRRFIGNCIAVVLGTPSKSDRDIQSACVTTLKQYQVQCEEKLPAASAVERIYQVQCEEKLPAASAVERITEANFGAIKLRIEEPMEKIWTMLHIFCYACCEFLKINHDIPVPRDSYKFPMSVELIDNTLPQISEKFDVLVFCLEKVLDMPTEQLTIGNQSIQDLHFRLMQLSLELCFGEEYPSIQSLATYCTVEEYRRNIRASIDVYKNYDLYLKLFRNLIS